MWIRGCPEAPHRGFVFSNTGNFTEKIKSIAVNWMCFLIQKVLHLVQPIKGDDGCSHSESAKRMLVVVTWGQPFYEAHEGFPGVSLMLHSSAWSVSNCPQCGELPLLVCLTERFLLVMRLVFPGSTETLPFLDLISLEMLPVIFQDFQESVPWAVFISQTDQTEFLVQCHGLPGLKSNMSAGTCMQAYTLLRETSDVTQVGHVGRSNTRQ